MFSIGKKIAAQLKLPIMDYCDTVYQNAHKSDLVPLNTACNRLCRFALGRPFHTHHCTLYNMLKSPSLNVRRHINWLEFIFKCIHFNYPPYLQQYFVPYTTNYQVRHSTQLYFSVPCARTLIGKGPCRFKAHDGLKVQDVSISVFTFIYLKEQCILTNISA